MLKPLKFLNHLWFISIFTMSMSYALPPSFCKPSDKGKIENSTVAFFANLAINSLFTFNFINYKEQLSSSTNLLNSEAWGQYNEYSNQLNLFRDTVDQKLIVSSYFKTNAKVLSDNNNTWQVTVPFIVTYQSAGKESSKAFDATMTIVQNNKQPINCGLQVTSIQFKPEVKISFFKNLFGIGFINIPYQENAPVAMKDNQDLQQQSMSDIEAITIANTWLLQHKINPNELNAPLIILQKGILQGRFSWRIKLNYATLLISRSADSPDGLDFKMSN